MGAPAATMSDIEALEKRLGAVERQLGDLRLRLIQPAPDRRSVEERLAGLDQIDRFREAVLRRRGGKYLPPSYEEIARAREERSAQILGEAPHE